jgi:hypothetical protein
MPITGDSLPDAPTNAGHLDKLAFEGNDVRSTLHPRLVLQAGPGGWQEDRVNDALAGL